MNQIIKWNLLVASVLLVGADGLPGQALPPGLGRPTPSSYVPGEVLVQFNSAVSDAEVAMAFQQARLGAFRQVLTPAMQDQGLIGITRAATAMPVETAVRLLQNLPGVDFAEPNWVAIREELPDDPYYTEGWLWGLFGDDLLGGVSSPIGPDGTTNPYGSQAEKAWAAGFIGSRDVYVGVVDGGFQLDHPDLAANLWTNPGEIPGNGIDDDGNGYIDDIHGWNAAGENGSVTYEDPINDTHGSHVAGTIGAVGNNGIGVVGVNWNVTLISGKMFGTNGNSVLDGIQAVDYMTALKTRKGLNVVALNHSWSSTGFSQALLDAISRAAQAGILSVCSAANNTNNNDLSPRYPASLDTTGSVGYDAVVAVAAINRAGGLASYSNWGQTSVDLGAPGGDRVDLSNPSLRDPDHEIVSTIPIDGYGLKRGTSMAAPHVTGAIALYSSIHPASTAPQTRSDLLWYGTRPLPALAGITVTGGTLDIGTLMEVPVNTLPTPVAPTGLQALNGVGGRVDLTWSDASPNELGFVIERFTDGQTYSLVDTVGANRVSYSDRTVQPNRTYLYRVRAYHAGGQSSSTVAASAVTVPNLASPTAPSNLAAKTQPGAVNLSWADKSNNEEGFRIERRTGTGSWTPLATVGPNTTKYTDPTTVWRTKYSYRVRAYNIAGTSATSNEVSVTGK